MDILRSSLIVSMFVLVASTVPAAADAWDVPGCVTMACVPNVVRHYVDSTADDISGDVQGLYEKVMDDFVSNKLPSMMSQVDTLAKSHEQAVSELIKQAKEISDSLTLASG